MWRRCLRGGLLVGSLAAGALLADLGLTVFAGGNCTFTGRWLRSRLVQPSEKQGDSMARVFSPAECRSPLEPGCRRCVGKLRCSAYQVYVSNRSAPGVYRPGGLTLDSPPPGLKKCARCTVNERRALEQLERMLTCYLVPTDRSTPDAADPPFQYVSAQGACDRYRSMDDFLMDPSFHAGSCEQYCFELRLLRSRCPASERSRPR